jgi:Cft2 family RNA processing exonuclease
MLQTQQVQTVIEPIVIYLEHMSKETLDVAKSHTSWMNFKDNSQFQDIEQNPCNFSYVKTITKLEEFKSRATNPDGSMKPLIILTSVSSMNFGFARQIIKDFAADKRNEVVFVEIQNSQVPKDSVAAKLLQK